MANTLASTGTTAADLFTTTALIPVFTGTLQGQAVQLCDARTLHTFMAVLRDFSNWIKGRIRKFGFVEGVDFAIVENLSSPDLANAKSRAQTLTDYHLTLDMAKELSMVENNAKGREARRYFMECEKQVLAALSTGYTLPAVISTAQCQHLKELVQLIVESGKQTFGETWNRLHRKMKVNKYDRLHPDQFDAACAYLQGKFDDTSIATLIQKHLPHAVPAIPMKNALQSLPAPQAKAMDVQTLCQLILGGIFTGRDFINLAYAVNQHQFTIAVENKHRGYGEEVAAKVKDMSWSDLHIINQKTAMEVWMRSEMPQARATITY